MAAFQIKSPMRKFIPVLSWAVCGLLWASPDIVLSDFEGNTFNDWKAQGNAFGASPVSKELPGQGPVMGHVGKSYANSWAQSGRQGKGTLTSPAFPIERDSINFLFGGPVAPGIKARLVVGGKTVREMSGFNSALPRLDWVCWDVKDLRGQEGQIVLQDSDETRALLADMFTLSDRDFTQNRPSRTLAIDQDYLLIPHDRNARAAWIVLRDADTGAYLREWVVRIGDLSQSKPDFWLYDHVAAFKGKRIRLEADWLPEGSKALEGIRPSADLGAANTDYTEALRPQFQYTPRRGRMNDINGFVWHKGQYHLMHQQNPYGVERGGLVNWGHAVSKDLIHWEELPVVVYTDELGAIYSGTAVIDRRNDSGLGKGGEPPIICIYTSAAGVTPSSYDKRTSQSLSYSADGGRTFEKYAGNPIVPVILGGNRDPKVFWHEPTKKWVMALFLRGHTYAILTSSDLKSWEEKSRLELPGAVECPDLFALGIDGDSQKQRWLFLGGNSSYLVGDFDGERFAIESGPHVFRYGCDYAAQTLNEPPAGDRRRIQMFWLVGNQPGMPFNQQAGLPRELTLHSTPQGPRIFSYPIEEVKALRRAPVFEGRDLSLAPDSPDPLAGIQGDLWDMEMHFTPKPGATLELSVFGRIIRYDAKAQTLGTGRYAAPLKPMPDGTIALRILIDRTSLEIYGNGGEISLSDSFIPRQKAAALSLAAKGAPVQISELILWPMRSIWKK